MTVQLRHPHPDTADTRLGALDDDPVRNPPNRIRLGRVCDGCRWAGRCRQDRICWAAEKADIARERLQPYVKPVWDETTIAEAMQAHVRRHGKNPTSTDWDRQAPGRPSTAQVVRVFGLWNNAIRDAGLKPGRGRRPGSW